jgi:hypothetical protein
VPALALGGIASCVLTSCLLVKLPRHRRALSDHGHALSAHVWCDEKRRTRNFRNQTDSPPLFTQPNLWAHMDAIKRVSPLTRSRRITQPLRPFLERNPCWLRLATEPIQFHPKRSEAIRTLKKSMDYSACRWETHPKLVN